MNTLFQVVGTNVLSIWVGAMKNRNGAEDMLVENFDYPKTKGIIFLFYKR
jgi:hypothetical protein